MPRPKPFRSWIFALLALATGAVAACSTAGGPPPTAAAPGAPGAVGDLATSYKLGSGDELRITTFQNPDLSGQFRLDGQGNFAMPLVGEVQAGGLSSRELEGRIKQRLSDGYLVDPQVSVEVLTYRPFYILGEVNSPGSFPYVNGMTVINAVALAGGFTYRASESGITLKRGGASGPEYSVALDTPILPGDILSVPERFF